MGSVNNFNWSQYPQMTINGQAYYLIQNIDDNLCIGILVSDTQVDDEAAGTITNMLAILVQLDGETLT